MDELQPAIIVLEFTQEQLWQFTKNLSEIVEPKIKFTGDMIEMQASVINQSRSLAVACLISIRRQLPRHDLEFVDRVLGDLRNGK